MWLHRAHLQRTELKRSERQRGRRWKAAPGWPHRAHRTGWAGGGSCRDGVGGVGGANVPSLQNQRAGLSWRPPLPAPFHPAFNEGPGEGGGGSGRLGLGRDRCWAQVEQSHERVKVMR